MIIQKIEPVHAEDTIGKIMSKLKKIEGLPVIDNDYIGMIYLKKIVVENVDISAKVKNFAENVPKINKDTPKEEIVKYLIDYPILPYFVDNILAGIITNTDVIQSENFSIDEAAEDFKKININEDIGKVRNMLSKYDYVVVEDNGEITGIVDYFSLSDIITTKKDELYMPGKIKEEKIKMRDFVKKIEYIQKDTKLSEIIKLLKRDNAVFADGKIITPKSILKNLKYEKKLTKLQISGLNDIKDEFKRNLVFHEFKNLYEKIERIEKIQEMKIRIRVVDKEGREFYIINSKIILDGNVITSSLEGWEVVDISQRITDKLITQVKKL